MEIQIKEHKRILLKVFNNIKWRYKDNFEDLKEILWKEYLKDSE